MILKRENHSFSLFTRINTSRLLAKRKGERKRKGKGKNKMKIALASPKLKNEKFIDILYRESSN